MQYVVIVTTVTDGHSSMMDSREREHITQQTIDCHNKSAADAMAKAIDNAVTYGRLNDGRSFRVSATTGIRHWLRKGGSVILSAAELDDLSDLLNGDCVRESMGKPAFDPPRRKTNGAAHHVED